MSEYAIKVENLSKRYRIGLLVNFGSPSLEHKRRVN